MSIQSKKQKRKYKITSEDRWKPEQFRTLQQAIEEPGFLGMGVMTPLAKHLLEMDPRFRFCQFGLETPKGIGYYPAKEAIYLSVNLPEISHEIGHHLEMSDPQRVLLADWGLSSWQGDKPISTSSVFAGFVREVRVLGIQQRIDPSAIKRTRLGNPAWENYLATSLPYGKFTDMKQVEEWERHIRITTYQQWVPDRIEQEWKDRLLILQNWMETHG